MRHLLRTLEVAAVIAVTSAVASGAPGTSQADAHISAARVAARSDYTDLFDTTRGLARPAMVINKALALGGESNR